MWPQIRTMIAERMQAAADGGAAMVVVEAAVMVPLPSSHTPLVGPGERPQTLLSLPIVIAIPPPRLFP